MLIVSKDEMFSAAIKQYLEDLKLDPLVFRRCVIVDLDFSSEDPMENAVTFSREASKNPDLLRPFLMTELAEAVIKRFSTDMSADKKTPAYASDLVLRADGVTYHGDFVPLTPKEREVLGLLLSKRGTAFSREEIFKALWQDGEAESNVVDVYIRYLRKKLDFQFGERIIYTKRGCGYYIK